MKNAKTVPHKPHKRKKITVVGSGFVGSSTAHWILTRGLADVSLIDLNKDLARGRALDLFACSPAQSHGLRLEGGGDFALAKGSDIVIITAGLPRRPGMSRDDLLQKNAKIVRSISAHLKTHCPQAFFIVISNPLDAMVSLARRLLDAPRERILGMAGVLDSLRFKAFVAEKTGCYPGDVSALVLGGHGDQMLPLSRLAAIGGVPLRALMKEKDIKEIEDRTRKGGAEIVSLLKTGSAHYAPAIGAVEMASAILKDQQRVLPCSAWLKGEYGEKDVFAGVPCLLGGRGLEKIIELDLNPDEKSQFKASVSAVRRLTAKMDQLLSLK